MQLSTGICRSRRLRRSLGAALAGALCVAAAAAPAVASANEHGTAIVTTIASGTSILETDDTRQTCTAPELLPAFSSFGDTRDYVLAPGGSFEGKDLDGWQVHRAKIGGDGSPLEIANVDKNKRSLTLPAGGSATTPAMCVDLHYPTLRLMTKAQQRGAQLRVEVIYPDSENPVFQEVGSMTADLERGGAVPGMRRLALRFTSVATGGGAGEWRLDDVYVDPRRRI